MASPSARAHHLARENRVASHDNFTDIMWRVLITLKYFKGIHRPSRQRDTDGTTERDIVCNYD